MRETAVESHPFRKVREKDGAPASGSSVKQLEAEASLEFNYATRQPGRRRAEQRLRSWGR